MRRVTAGEIELTTTSGNDERFFGGQETVFSLPLIQCGSCIGFAGRHCEETNDDVCEAQLQDVLRVFIAR